LQLSHLVLKQQSLEDQKQEYSRFDKKNQELFCNNNYPAVCRLCLNQNNQKTTTIIKTTRNNQTHNRSLKKLLQTFRQAATSTLDFKAFKLGIML